MTKARDFKAEYARRIARGAERGLSRSQARGHPRPGERVAGGTAAVPYYDKRLETGLKTIRRNNTTILRDEKEKSVREVARSLRVAPERLTAYLRQTGVVEKRGGRWRVGLDLRWREIPLYSGGRLHAITVPSYDDAFQIGRYMAAVKEFKRTNDASLLEPFIGQSVTDVKGRRYVFETRPNVLYQLTLEYSDAFEQVYRIIV